MSKEPLKVDEKRVSEMIALSGRIRRILIAGTKHAPTEIERLGMMAGALVGAAQEIDGTDFRRPGVTSMVLDVLARGHGRFMSRLAQALKGRAGDNGDSGDKQGTDETVSPSVPVENAQELASPAPRDAEGNIRPSKITIETSSRPLLLELDKLLPKAEPANLFGKKWHLVSSVVDAGPAGFIASLSLVEVVEIPGQP